MVRLTGTCLTVNATAGVLDGGSEAATPGSLVGLTDTQCSTCRAVSSGSFQLQAQECEPVTHLTRHPASTQPGLTCQCCPATIHSPGASTTTERSEPPTSSQIGSNSVQR